ncbi:MAG: YeiH family putative sulfate export transporter [Sphingomonadales bacterium]|nr:YeiH family putative sulfate export transporter [Sphingomonadales bacterium]MDE2171430.1 YeiH family putative sulfate export transporter [Sphingomonadales bacterium]
MLRLWPGVVLCLLVTAAAYGLQVVEQRLFTRAWLEALVLAILVGTGVRSLWPMDRRYAPGIAFSAKYLLEIAVVLLGASVSLSSIIATGPALLAGIAGTVVTAIGASFLIGRGLGLPVRMALLVACGNSICGNSAIVAVAPVIGADSDDVAASIGFTAVLGIAVVLGLPVLGWALHMDAMQYGTLAGLTVYAVPQVIAASAPLGAVAVQMGTLVKLVRVLMLGPVCVMLSVVAPGLREEAGAPHHKGLSHLVPWFIIGFLGLCALRSVHGIPDAMLAPASQMASFLTVVSMAALGLGVDLRTIARAGGKVTFAAFFSLIVLGGISLMVIRALHIA